MVFGKNSFKELKPLLTTSNDVASISKIHAVIIKSGIFNNGALDGDLIAGFARLGHIGTAHKLFDDLSHRGTASWNALLTAYSRRNSTLQVLNLYNKMTLGEAKPDSSSFTVTIKACSTLSDLESGDKIWKTAVACGYGDDIFVCSSALRLYAKCGKIDEAMNVFEGMSKRDAVAWSTMITGYVKSGRAREAVEMYRRMVKEGVEGDGVSVLALIQACAYSEDLKMACSLHGHMTRRGLPLDVMIQTSLIDMYAKNRQLRYASVLFRSLSCKNVVSWSTLISGYVQNGLPIQALELLIEMQSYGFEPDEISVVSALMACSQAGLTVSGREIHGYILRRLDVNHVLSTALIDMYAKCGSLLHARVIFDRIVSLDIILWNTIIASYGIHGQGNEALSVFHQMMKSDVEPDHATFASLLSAMSHSGLVDEGLHWFDIMVRDYKIRPMEKHYVSLIDLLARSGQVEKAHSLIGSFEYEPGIAVWVALLSGCLNHKKFLIGDLAARKVLELKPESPGIYSLVSNFYAGARKWDQVMEVRRVMKDRGMKKEPGYSVMELKGRRHIFLVGDRSHSQYVQIERILEEMKDEITAMGYVPKTEFILHDVEDDVKVKMLWNHSERLAIAFGILNTEPGTRLLVTKNLRVCGDCHEAIKFITIIAKRDIVVRDMKRFHHFKNGSCSCRDYW